MIKDDYGNRIVMINDIEFKGKRQINGDEVKEHLECIDEKVQMQRPKQMRLWGFRSCLKLQQVSIIERIMQTNIREMQKMDGIVMILGLRFRYILIMEKLGGIMFIMRQC